MNITHSAQSTFLFPTIKKRASSYTAPNTLTTNQQNQTRCTPSTDILTFGAKELTQSEGAKSVRISPINPLQLQVLPQDLSVCRMDSQAPVPEWATRSSHFTSVSKIGQELSIITETDYCPKDIKAESGFKAIKVSGTLDFSLIGILANLTTTLAKSGISVFALSTYDTDYLLVRKEQLDEAKKALQEAGHQFI